MYLAQMHLQILCNVPTIQCIYTIVILEYFYFTNYLNYYHIF